MKSRAFVALAAFAACATPEKKEIVVEPPQVVVADPNIVTLDGLLDSDLVRAVSDGQVIVRLRIDTREIEIEKRPVLNLALAIDTSGSMEGEAIGNARVAALELIDRLRDGDRIALIGFSSVAEVLVPTTEISAGNRAAIKDEIRAMKARGTTDMSNGLALALAQVSSSSVVDGLNRIVLLSDGVPNEDQAIRGIADQARSSGISITALGLGLDYDESLLGEIAQRSGGTFHFIEKSEQVAKVFSEQLIRLEQIVARGMNLRIVPGPGVQVAEVIGHQARASGRALYVDLGDLAAGEQRDLFVKLAVGGRVAGANVELLDAFLGFQDGVAGAGQLQRDLFLSVRASDDDAALEKAARPELAREALRAELAAITIGALAMARAGQLEQAKAMLVEAEPRARAAAERYADPDLAAQADEMVKLLASLPTIVPVQAVSPDAVEETAPAAPPMADSVRTEAPAAIRRAHGRAMKKLQPRSRGARFPIR